MKLTEKGKEAFELACKHYRNESFSAADLSAASGIKIAAASLTALEKKGLLEKFPTKPVSFKIIEGAEELVAQEEESTKKGRDNSNLAKAKKEKNDEFYTRYEDIEAEVSKYKEYFKNKVVYLNCDNKEKSMFWKFFELNFDAFQLKKLIATYYSETEPVYAYKLELRDGFIDHKDIVKTPLVGNGDFRSQECIDILKESDIVCSNPPFSLFREYVAQLMEYNKQFLILGNNNAVSYKEIFPLIKDNKIWLGYSCNKTMKFYVPNRYEAQGYDNGVPYVKVPAITWFTNIPNKKRNEPMVLTATYAEGLNHREDYPKYDNYDAIEVSKCKNIPCDYDGVMGVPITFLDYYCPEQFELLGCTYPYGDCGVHYEGTSWDCIVDGKHKYARMFIKRKSQK